VLARDLRFDLHWRLFSDFAILQRSLYAYEMISQGRHQGVSLAIAIILIESALNDRTTIFISLSLSLSLSPSLSLFYSRFVVARARLRANRSALIRNFFMRSERCLPGNYHRDLTVIGSIYRRKCNIRELSRNIVEYH